MLHPFTTFLHFTRQYLTVCRCLSQNKKLVLLALLLGVSVNPARAIAHAAEGMATTPELTMSVSANRFIAQAMPLPVVINTDRRVQVFFPVFPAANDDFTQVAPVWRTTRGAGVARFAVEQLIAGPTATEQRQGLRPVVAFQGSSTCRRDFTLSISNGVARLQFCRQVISGGVGDDARLRSAIAATLQQFSTVNDVVILNPDGSCFGDMSGENRCYEQL